MATMNPCLSIEQSDSVELIVDRFTDVSDIDDENKIATSVKTEKHIHFNDYIGSMISLSLLVMIIVDILILVGIISIYFKVKNIMISNKNTVATQVCDGSLSYLTDINNIMISVLCLISSCLFVTAIQKVRLYQSRVWIVVYIISMIIHFLLLHYETNFISNIHNDTRKHCIMNVEKNINFVWHILQIKTIILTIIFIVVFAYRVYIRFIMSRSVNFKRFYFGILVITFISLLFSMIDYYFNDGTYIHGIRILFGLLFAKYHLYCTHHHDHIDSQHLTETYDANATEGAWCCCKAGWGIDCKSGCCECNSSHTDNCCVICGTCYGGCAWGCTQADYPGSICFSCCGACTCYCCDPGGCCDLGCCSIDWFTWCCC